MSVSATSITRLPDPTRGRSKACKRCGFPRKDARPTSPICRDCKDVLTPAEQEAWGCLPDHTFTQATEQTLESEVAA